MTGHYGFMESPEVPPLLATCCKEGFDLDPGQVSYFLSKETILPASRHGMMLWREKLFAVMSRNAISAASFFGLPPNRVVELGMQVEI